MNLPTSSETHALDQPELAFARRRALEILVRLVSPVVPHINDENYARLQSAFAALVAGMPWPQPDSVLLAMDTVTIAEQITGKLRGAVAAPWTRRPTWSL